MPVIGERQTVGDFLEHWLELKKPPKLRIGTWNRYRDYIMLHTVPTLGRVKLKQLTPQHLERLYAQQLAAGASSSSVHHQHKVIKTALKHALRQGLIVRNPAELVDPPKMARPEISPLSEVQARRLLKEVESDRLVALYVVALATGMRQGELLALRWQDVKLSARSISVCRSVRWVPRTGFVWNEPKTKRSRRTISISPQVVVALRLHQMRQQGERERLGTAWRYQELVFTTAIGTPLESRNVLRNFHRHLEVTGLPHIRFHDLRHTAATLLLSQNVNPKVVSEMLGHSSVSTTLDIYSHVLPHMQHDASMAMESMLFESQQVAKSQEEG
jgi:integrase